METFQENHNQHGINGVCSDHVFSTELIKEDDMFGELKVLPRVGDQYQADLPPLVTEHDQKSPIHKNRMDVNLIEFSVCLPTLMWGINKFEARHESAKSPSGFIERSVSKESLKSEDCKPKVEKVGVTSDVSMIFTESTNLPLESEVKVQSHGDRGYGSYLIPGFPDDTWNDIEEASFVLGLYIFGKNLVQLQQFIENKRMGDILSFYYGKFYKSESYCRWSECRKTRSRKCIYGQKIFTGPRQQELLTRLSSHVSNECHNTLLQVTKAFRDGKMSLEEYVFSLKTTVGLKVLISAVGIGKGKEDLTGMTVEAPKSDQVVSLQPEMPFGKPCSDLTPLEITKFLSGNYRLSKARSGDLFWEAVWPRLLARGWHSEQPSDHFYASDSHSLVFIIPGVKKFSRRKLVKGKHYFDSVSDVLRKIASDPGLLELETGAEGENNKDEDRCCGKNKLEDHESSILQSDCYIKPCSQENVADSNKFTVVDTSLANRGKFKVSELRSLPVEMNSCHSQTSSVETEEESCQVSHSTDESDSATSVLSDKSQSNHAKTDSTGISVILCDGNSRMELKSERRKTKEDQTNKKKRPSEKVEAAITAKQPCKSISCSRVDTVCTNVAGYNTKQLESNCRQGNLDLPRVVIPSQEVREDKLASLISCTGRSPIRNEVIVNRNEVLEPQTLIDLNLYGHTSAQSDHSSMTDMPESECGVPTTSANDAGELRPPVVPCSSKLLPALTATRHSTRNRPLTLKALEALACGFLTTTVKRKRRGSSPSKAASRPSVHSHGQKRQKNKDLDSNVVNPKQGSGMIQIEMGPDLGILQRYSC